MAELDGEGRVRSVIDAGVTSGVTRVAVASKFEASVISIIRFETGVARTGGAGAVLGSGDARFYHDAGVGAREEVDELDMDGTGAAAGAGVRRVVIEIFWRVADGVLEVIFAGGSVARDGVAVCGI